MQILVHICCAPCLTYPYKQIIEKGHEITGFFYNPNIHPYSEYKKRLNSLEKYAEIKGLKWIHKHEYDIENYLRSSLNSKDRCCFCYKLRLFETAKMASLLEFNAFTTTLLISPYQRHDDLILCCEKAADEYSVEFYYEDFRKGYKESRQISCEFELYMQKYCGCIFSQK